MALGAKLGEQLRAGDVVVLSGPLGAGKTVLAKGIAEAMDVDGPVTSPTFVLARVHPRAAVRLRPPWCTSTCTGCWTTPAPTCSANSTRSTSTPTWTTPSSSSSGERASSSGSRSATSTSGWNARADTEVRTAIWRWSRS